MPIAPRPLTPAITLLLGLLAPACEGAGDPADAEPFVDPDITPEPVSAAFTLEIDRAHPDLEQPTLEPVAAPIRVTGGSAAFALHARARRLPARPDLLALELYLENRDAVALRDVLVEVDGAAVLHDLTVDPFAAASDARDFSFAGLGPEGLARLVLAVPRGDEPLTLTLRAAAETTKRVAASSATLALSPDGRELWAPFPDGDVVAVIDTASDRRVASVAVPGRPTSVAVSPDGALVLVTSATGNAVHVIDRARREVVQTLGEADGVAREPRHLVLSPDGSHAYVSAHVDRQIVALQRRGDRYVVEGAVDVGPLPTGLTVTPDGGTVLVAHFLPRGKVRSNEGWLSLLSTAPLKLEREVIIEDAFNLDAAHCLADVFGVSPKRMTNEGVSSSLWGAFLDPGGNHTWVPGARIAGATIAWELGPDAVELGNIATLRKGELVAPFIFLFDSRSPRDTEPLLLPGVLDPPDVNLDFVRCARLGLEIELISRDLIPGAPDQQVNRAAAFPNGTTGLSESGSVHSVGFTRGGRRALLLSHMADEIAVVDAATFHPTSQLHATLAGANPTGLVVTPDGRKGYVAYANSTFVSTLDLSAYADPKALPGPSYVPYTLRDVPEFPSAPGALTGKRLVRDIADVPTHPPIAETGQIALVDADPVDPTLRRGAVLFHSSNLDKYPGLTATRLGACASCHPDGGSDGSMWGTMEGERKTMSLAGGVAGRGWLHASATHADAAEFVTTILPERLGGALGPKDAAALTDYLARGVPALQPPTHDVALAAAGAAVFASKCAGCHAGPAHTSGNPDPDDPLGGGLASGPALFDVGTATDNAFVILGSFFESLFPEPESTLFAELRGDRDLGEGDWVQQQLDFRQRPDRARGQLKAPSLRNVWHSPLFFHDGRFSDLGEVIDHLDAQLGLDLAPANKPALIEYLKTL